MDFYIAGLALLDGAREVGEIPENDSQLLLNGGLKWLPETGAGVHDVSMSVALVLQRAGKTLSDSNVFEIMSYSYQVVLYSEILSKLQREVTETEVREMELASPSCMACIAEQIRLVADAATMAQSATDAENE